MCVFALASTFVFVFALASTFAFVFAFAFACGADCDLTGMLKKSFMSWLTADDGNILGEQSSVHALHTYLPSMARPKTYSYRGARGKFPVPIRRAFSVPAHVCRFIDLLQP